MATKIKEIKKTGVPIARTAAESSVPNQICSATARQLCQIMSIATEEETELLMRFAHPSQLHSIFSVRKEEQI